VKHARGVFERMLSFITLRNDAHMTSMASEGSSSSSAQYRGCLSHASGPRLRATGNPTACSNISEHITKVERMVKMNEIEGSESLLPIEVIRVFQNQFQQNSVWEMMFGVLICIMIATFTRNDDVSGKRQLGPDPEDFVYGLQVTDIILEKSFISPDGKVDYICLSICGKKDQLATSLLLWRNRVCGAFCPVRFLLWWLLVSGIREG
jgi:hypothetical protein